MKEGSQVSSSLAALQAEREALLRSARDRDAEISSLKQQLQQQQAHQDLERDRLQREVEALRAQLQQQVKHTPGVSVCEGGSLLFGRCQTLLFLPTFPQLNINAEQKLEIDRLKRELEAARADLSRANSNLQSREMVRARKVPIPLGGRKASAKPLSTSPQSGTQLSGTLAGLQAEREVLLRSLREQEAQLSSLRQQAELQHSSAQQERQRSSMEMGSLQAQLQQQVRRSGPV